MPRTGVSFSDKCRGQASHSRLKRSRPQMPGQNAGTDKMPGQAFYARFKHVENAEDRRFMLGSNDPGPALICLSRAPLAGRPRLLGAATYSGQMPRCRGQAFQDAEDRRFTPAPR
jgi:hypothetical protein